MSASSKLLLVLVIALGGCGDRATGTDSGAPDAGPRPDTLQPPPTGPWGFAPEDDGSASPAIAIRPDPAGTGPGSLILVARGVPKLQGIAFRLRFDAKAIKAVKQEVSASWYGSGKDLVSKIAVRPDGEIWAGIGYSGSHGLDATGEVTLAKLAFEPGSGAGPLPLSFRPGRNLVIDPNASKVALSWLGGSFRRQ